MEAMMLARGMTPAHRHLRSRLTGVVVATLVLDVGASLLVWRLEHGRAGTGIHTLGDALFWTSTQLLTVSSQLPNPLSPPARVLDILLQAYAISVVAILAGSFGAFFHGRTVERAEPASQRSIEPAPQRSIVTASRGREQQSNRRPGAGSSSGSGW